MNISKNEIQEFEEEYENSLRKTIGKYRNAIDNIIKTIKDTARYIEIDIDIPNIAITFNNKLNELAQEFNRSNMSIYVKPVEEYDLVETNFVGDALISELFIEFTSSIETLGECIQTYNDMNKERNLKIKEIENAGFFKKIAYLYRVIIKSSDELEFQNDDIEQMNMLIKKYKEIDDKIWKFNIRDNVIQCITNYLKQLTQSCEEAPDILQEDMCDTLEKLGLGYMIPKLEEKLDELEKDKTITIYKLNEEEKEAIEKATKEILDRISNLYPNTEQAEKNENNSQR